MHASGNLVFVAAVPRKLCEPVERELIWRERDRVSYNNQGIRTPPRKRIDLRHLGEAPRFLK
jgi:hypothetical protein